MYVRRRRGWLDSRLSLTRQVALLSLVPIAALGFLLARVLQQQIVARTLADATESAQIVAHVAIQPRLTPQAMRDGLSPQGVAELDKQLSARSVTRDLARIKIWNSHYRVIYSDDHKLIGRTLVPSDDLLNALAGRPNDAEVVTPSLHSETASEVGLGQLVEVYVPLHFTATGPSAGAFEIYLSYRPIAAAIASDERTIALLIAIGLALLWAILYRIVARASRRLRRQASENYELARHDQLTGLPNRTLFLEELNAAARHPESEGGEVAVLLIDLERFREINNTLGYASGDQVLCEFAARLRSDLGPATLLARLGGDEYAVLCPRREGIPGALEMAAAVHASLESPIELVGVALNLEASIGIAAMGEHAHDVDALLQHADVALARARMHCSRVEVYSPEFDCFDSARLVLLGQVRGALERDEFILHYQPKLDMRTRRIVGVEALLRWRHPQHGMLAPMRFIPLIEQTALVGPVTLHLIDQALRQLVAWRRLGVRLEMSVNLAARNLLDLELPGHIAELLLRHDVAPAQLVLEVTESAAMADPDRAIKVLEELRASGVGVSVDDFGTGNASIEYLATLPASELKIDRSFVTGMLEDTRAEAIVRSIIDLAGNLSLSVVAEGIETEAVLERLSALGCDVGQGYFISRPVPPDELTAWLRGALGAGPPEPDLESARSAAAVGALTRSPS